MLFGCISKLQKIKEKYLTFRGGDLTSVGLSNCAVGFCQNLYTGPPIYFFSRMFFDFDVRVGSVYARARTTHSPGAVNLYGS